MSRTYAPTSVIRESRHPALRPLRDLQLRAARDGRGLFLADGVRFVLQAIEQGARLDRVIVCPELWPPRGLNLVARLRRAGIPLLELTAPAYRSISLAHEPQGIAAVVHKEWTPLWHAHPVEGGCWVAVSELQSPGNLGTILRTCDAIGARGLICLDGSADPWDPGVVRASMGALFTQRLIRASAEELNAWKRRHGVRVVGTSPSAPLDYRGVDYRRPVVLFLGWERKGLSAEETALCDDLVRIPMVGRSDSLNVAVAAGVMLYEVFSQRNP